MYQYAAADRLRGDRRRRRRRRGTVAVACGHAALIRVCADAPDTPMAAAPVDAADRKKHPQLVSCGVNAGMLRRPD